MTEHKESTENWYRNEVFGNKEDYPNLFELEEAKNRWKFSQPEKDDYYD